MILGIEWEPWTIAHTVAVEKLMDLSLTSDFYTEFAREELNNLVGPEFTEMVYPHRVQHMGKHNFSIMSDDELKQAGLY